MTAQGTADHNQGTPADSTLDPSAPTTTMADVAPDEMIKGVDLSHHNREDGESFDWTAATADGVRFVIFKATQFRVDSSEHPDGVYHEHLGDNWQGVRAAQASGIQIAMGTYHFLVPPDGKDWKDGQPVPPLEAPDPAQTIELQAQRYLDAIGAYGGHQRGDLPPALDLESRIMTRICECFAEDDKRPVGYDEDKPWSWIARWCEIVWAATGCKPMLYVRRRGLRRLKEYADDVHSRDPFGTLTDHELWIVDPNHSEPEMPDPAYWATWRLWQYTGVGTADGIPDDDIDCDRFNGDEADFEAWLDGLYLVPVFTD